MRRLAVAAVFSLVGACGGDPKSAAKQAESANIEKAEITGEPFAIVRINDDVDAFEKISDDQVPFGSGVALFQETVPRGLRHFGIVHFARLLSRPDEGQLDTISRFLKWTDRALPLPPGNRFGFGDLLQQDEATKVTSIIGLRTFVITGDPIITHRDVADAHIIEGDEDVPQIGIALKLNEVGTRKLAEGTRSWPFRRVAIITHGKIDTAPVIKAEIQGGEIELEVGARSDRRESVSHDDAIVARAKKLVEEILQK